jgi:predicted PurR-regulated permease PerM
MGKSLSAQATIALFNTAFTAGIIHYLGLGEKAFFLSLIVLVCGLIPVAGVFISSLPICLMVLQDQGPGMVIVAILGIWIVHLIETYILNPKIWGHHLHINPVLVLIILTVSGKLFGVWGLILGLPLSKYIFGYAIQYHSAEEVEAQKISH